MVLKQNLILINAFVNNDYIIVNSDNSNGTTEVKSATNKLFLIFWVIEMVDISN